jgi:hypothetical protein
MKLSDWTKRKQEWIIDQKCRTDYKCENCHLPEAPGRTLIVHPIDWNYHHQTTRNSVVLCPGCYKLFSLSNLDGLSPQNGIWACCINRNLYPTPAINKLPPHAQRQKTQKSGQV